MLIARTHRPLPVSAPLAMHRFPAGPRAITSAEPRLRLDSEGKASSTLDVQLPNRAPLTLKDMVVSINVDGVAEGEELTGYLTGPHGFGVTFPIKRGNGVDRTYTLDGDFRGFFRDLPANGQWELAIKGPRGTSARFNSWTLAAYGDAS